MLLEEYSRLCDVVFMGDGVGGLVLVGVLTVVSEVMREIVDMVEMSA